MKVLIADDDTGIRFALKRLFLSLECTPIEADSGIAALQTLSETEDVSLLVLDVGMPLMNGLEVLQAVRESREHAHLPVVMVSGISDPVMASDLINLGVMDFLAKPFKLDKARIRLQRVIDIVRKKQGASVSTSSLSSARPVVIVDGSPEFRYFAANTLSGRFPTVEAKSGLDAVQVCMSCRPVAVLIGSDLGMFGSRLLARKLRSHQELADTRVLIVAAPGDASAHDPAGVDGVLTRTYVPEQFLRQVEQFVTGSANDGASRLFGVVQQALAAATQQALGMMAHTDVAVVPGGSERNAQPEISGSVVLNETTEDAAVQIALWCAPETATTMAARMLQIEESMLGLEDAMSVVGELVNIVAGRLQAVIAGEGGSARFSLPDVQQHESGRAPSSDVTLRFESTARDLTFRVLLSSHASAAQAAAAAA